MFNTYFMNKKENLSTRVQDYIIELLPWAHGHQIDGISDFVSAIIEKRTANQAELSRSFGNQEAATRRLSRLIHNQRIPPREIAESIFEQSLLRLPKTGKVRLAIDWTIEGDHHLLVVSLVTGHRSIPIYWRAYSKSVLKGRMRGYEMAVIKRVLTRIKKAIGNRRLIVTADRGFADVDLAELFESFRVKYVIRVKRSTKVFYQGKWRNLSNIAFEGNSKRGVAV